MCVCVFLVVGGERHVFKVHVNGVKKGVYRLWNCYDLLPSCHQSEHFIFFFLMRTPWSFCGKKKKASLIGVQQSTVYLFGWLMGCQTAKTQTAACPYIFWSGHIKVNAWFLSVSVLLTCRSSLGTSSYVLESVEVLLEEVAHLVWETTDKVNLHKNDVSKNIAALVDGLALNLSMDPDPLPLHLTHRKECRAASRMLAMVSTST